MQLGHEAKGAGACGAQDRRPFCPPQRWGWPWKVSGVVGEVTLRLGSF